MNNAALNARLADVFAGYRAAGAPATVRQVQGALGWRFAPVWETEQLLERGWIARVANEPGVHCVDGRYAPTKPGTGR